LPSVGGAREDAGDDDVIRVIRAASWVVATLSCVAGVAALIVATPAPASAATAYRYWAFYLAHGSTWQYAQRGPASEYPADGDVEGWRFALQTDAAGGLTPRDVPDFAALCASTPPKAGQVRVGIVIDFGVASDAPVHESPPAGVVPGCVYVDDGASGAAVLQAATTVRIGTGSKAGLVCGIDGYPASECGPAVTVASAATPTTQPTKAPTASTTPTPRLSAAVAPAGSVGPHSSSVVPQGSAPAENPPPVAGLASATLVPLGAAGQPASSGFVRLRSNNSGRITAVVGGVLVIAFGGAAIWRARRGRP
jgi:hypothetical protein